ncbi:SusC/RagA family TonB-linked outer membrane protein [Reichenbachiella ulvae]|uniref:TonB-dependent receptor n=1 Tax=Reichenbachiella ulvae TaxID=2980104 RepID=A0ABT3D0N1_9BACT|nr:TonB-dependent receptor [Reichenbachiella ulvae]MCV9389295.1 TonB-dependent receptor [Reichenbachiella ulvae]
MKAKITFLLMIAMSIWSVAWAQTEIQGTVRGSDGDDLIGASVLIKGTTNGTITDESGKYRLQVSDASNAILLVSYVGYKSLEIPVNGRSAIDVELPLDAEQLEEIVVVGYGASEKKDLTGSIGKISAKDFNGTNVNSAEQIMQGKVAGLNIATPGGQPGQGTRIRIRGGSSFGASNEPLYVIDGVQVGLGGESGTGNDFGKFATSPIDYLNPADIESITVLKDASASAIYGARAANGVIIITTKKGKAGSMRVDYDGNIQLGSPIGKYDVMDADEYEEALNHYGLPTDNVGNENTDWQDEILRNTVSQSHSLSLSGGTETTTYRASVLYKDQEGAMLGTGMDQLVSRLNLTQSAINNRLTLGMNIMYSNTQYDNRPTQDAMRYALLMNPSVGVKDENGDWNTQLISFNTVNPVRLLQEVQDETTKSNFIGNFTAQFDVSDHLFVNVDYGATRYNTIRQTYYPSTIGETDDLGGQGGDNIAQGGNNIFNIRATYKNTFAERHNLSVMIGHEYQKNHGQGTNFVLQGYSSDLTGFYDIGGASSLVSKNGYYNENKLASFLGRINYSFDNKYILTVNMRADGTDKVAEDYRWGLFPSFSVGWNLINESFLQGQSLFSDLKLRAGYGTIGNQDIPSYRNVYTYSPNGWNTLMGNGNRVGGIQPTREISEDLKWETTTTTNVGLDFGILDDKITGSIDLYSKTTEDLLMERGTIAPAISNTVMDNIGEISNKGIELSLNAAAVQGSDFNLNLGLVFASNKNEVVALDNEDSFIPYGPFRAPGYSLVNGMVVMPGEALTSFWGYDFVEVRNGVEYFRNAEGIEVSSGDLTDADKIITGQAAAKFTYGLTLSGNYKRFDFSMLFRGSQGNDVFNITNLINSQPSMTLGDGGQNALSGTMGEGEELTSALRQVSNRYIEDGSFFRMDNLTLGYTLNTESLPWLTRARVYAQAQNVFLISGYSGPDPEVFAIDPSFASGIQSQSYDYNIYPKSRTITLGAQISF